MGKNSPSSLGKQSQEVAVKNWPKHKSLADDYFRTLRRRYQEFQEAAKKNQKNQTAVMRYYTPKGQEVRIANISKYDGEETILLQGDIEEEDRTRNPCDILVQPQNAQVVLKLLVLDAPNSEQAPARIHAPKDTSDDEQTSSRINAPIKSNPYGRREPDTIVSSE